jgi:hypothetical protein
VVTFASVAWSSRREIFQIFPMAPVKDVKSPQKMPLKGETVLVFLTGEMDLESAKRNLRALRKKLR